MSNSALDLAKYIINKCTDDNCAISNLQLQKILFFIQKECLSNNLTAFSDVIEAWPFGPVVPAVYYVFFGYGASAISMRYDGITIEEGVKAIANPLIEKLRKKNVWELVQETHRPGSSWYVTFDNGNGNHKVITLDCIRKNG